MVHLIAKISFSGGFTSVFVGTRCLPWPMRYLLLLIYMAFALQALHAAVCAVGPWERRISFAAMFIMRICVLCIRYSPYGDGHPEVTLLKYTFYKFLIYDDLIHLGYQKHLRNAHI